MSMDRTISFMQHNSFGHVGLTILNLSHTSEIHVIQYALPIDHIENILSLA